MLRRERLSRFLWLCFAMSLQFSGTAVAAARVQDYHMPAGEAPHTLDEFSRQSGEQIVYLIENVQGERTRAVRGRWTAQDALQRMLTGTALMVHRDPVSGAMIVTRRATRPTRPAAGAPPAVHPLTAAASAGDGDNEIVVLSAFTVSTSASDRYRATNAHSTVRVRTALFETPSSVTVVTREMMDDLAPTRIFDVTRYVAGVQDGRGLQFQDRMIIRGFESNGQRSVDNFLQPDDADNIDETIIERIEVTKGPNAILSPAGAPGGSVNVVTKSPSFRPQRSLTAVAGLFDAQKLTLDLAGPLGRDGSLAYRLVGAVQDSRRYWDDDSRLRGRVLAPMMTWRASENTTLTMKLIAAQHWIFREPLIVLDPTVGAETSRPIFAPGLVARSRNGIQPWSHVGTRSADVFALLTTTLAESVELRVAANGRHYFEDSEQNFLSTPSLANRYDPHTGELTQDQVWSRNPATGSYQPTFSPFFDPTNIPNRADRQATHRSTGNLQADAVWRRSVGETTSQTVAGLAFSRRTARGRGQVAPLPGIDLRERDRRVTPSYAGASLALNNRATFSNAYAYVHQRTGLWRERVQLSAGALLYHTHTEFRNLLTNSEPTVLDDRKAMWQAGALWRIRDRLALYYNHSTNASPTIANDAPLWRDGAQDEIGFKCELFDAQLSLNGAWFRINQSNVTVPNPARQTDLTAPETLVGDFGNHGFELELLGRLTPHLSAVASYSHLTMHDSLGRHVRGVADHVGAILLNYRCDDGWFPGLSLNAGVTYTSRRAGDVPISFTPLGVVGQTSFFLEPYYATMLGASFRWRERCLFRVTVDNVFDDKDFIVVAGGRVSGTGITTQPGMNVKFATTVEF